MTQVHQLVDDRARQALGEDFIAEVEHLCTQGQKKYLSDSQNYFLKMLSEVDDIFLNHLSRAKKIRILEVGPFLPYTVALINEMKKRHGVEITLDVIDMSQDSNAPPPERFSNVIHHYIAGNIENDHFEDHYGQYDLVLFTSVLEHLVAHPYGAVCEIYNLMAPLGILFISVPNALTIVNLYKYLSGQNLHDHYSLESPYGRHNREYTTYELSHLFKYLEMASLSIKPVKFNPIARLHPWRTRVFDLLYKIKPSLGTDIFAVGRKGKIHISPPQIPPAWWYRYTPGLMTTFR